LFNFGVIRYMILAGTVEPHTTVTVHTEKKINSKRKGGVLVSIITEHEDKLYRFSFFKTRRLDDNTSVPFRYK